MAKNKVDFKQLMLEKGERIGLGVAAGIMVLLLGLGGYAAAMRDSPATTAEDITNNSFRITKKLETDPPLSNPKVDPGSLVPVVKDPVPSGKYGFVVDLTINEDRENKKRINPVVLEPKEWQKDLVRAQVRNLMIAAQGDNVRIGILVPKEKGQDKTQPDTQNVNKRFQNSVFKPAPGMQTYMVTNYTLFQTIAKDENGLSKDKYNLEFINVKDKASTGAKFAETVHPLRMVVFTASFPYRQQLEVYKKSLKLKSIAELAGQKDLMPRFEPCKLQRRIVFPNGKVGEWVEVDLEGTYKPVLQQSVGTQPEDNSVKPVIFPRTPLVMPLPRLARGEYPALKDVPELEKAARAVVEKTKGNDNPVMIHPLAMKLRGEGLNPFEPVIPDGERRDMDPPPARDFKLGDEPIIPEVCMIRIIDADPKLKPGATYQYQVKIRLQNPNEGQFDKVAYPDLARKKEIESDWTPADPSKLEVKVSRELYYYPTKLDDKALSLKERSDPTLIMNKKDVAYVQAHSWIENVRLDPENTASKVPLGDWAVTDIPIKRGEFISRTESVEMAIWYPTRQDFDMAVPVRKARTPLGGGRPLPGIPVSFITDDLLVDFEGGRVDASFKVGDKSKTISENADLEILVMNSDGVMRVLNSAVELKNAERERRTAEVQKFLTEVRNRSKNKPKDDFPK